MANTFVFVFPFFSIWMVSLPSGELEGGLGEPEGAFFFSFHSLPPAISFVSLHTKAN
jgi:hypothetical protein